ncbi:MAG: LysE family translocator [Sinimarinibacterium sp.]|jgi:threonine/homoserine/homoserine lactone efflux protein
MSGIEHFGVFIAAAVLLILTPGTDTAYIVGRSMAQGRRVGIAAALGINAGCVCHTIAAALGLSAFLATTAWAFTAVKLLGAAYLIVQGIRYLLQRAAPLELPSQFSGRSATVAFRQGVITNVLNPKVALFFLAFLPQFIHADAPSPAQSFLLLGFTFVIAGTLWCITLAWCAAAVSDRLRGSATVGALLNRTVGALFVGLGVRLALAK